MRKMTESSMKGKLSHQVGHSTQHDSAIKHVTGAAQFVDDMPTLHGCLHAYPITAPIACGEFISLDKAALMDQPGVIAVLMADDIPGHKDIGPVFEGDILLVEQWIAYHHQPLGLVIAKSYDHARKAARHANIKTIEHGPLLDVSAAIKAEEWVRPPHQMMRGQVDPQTAAHTLEDTLTIGGQEHFYLEGQVAIADPTEDGGMFIRCSSQHPSEVQKLVAEVLAIPFNLVTVEMRRMGGGFGGKETQAAQWACLAALAAFHTGQSVKVRLARSDDFKLTGKRHPFTHHYQIGFDDAGIIQQVEAEINGHCGYSPDLSDAIVDRAMFHADNAYYYPNARFIGNRVKLNTHSHTAFRGFGGPQGVILAEKMLDDIAYKLGRDPLAVRIDNLYRDGADTTVYGQKVEQRVLKDLIEQLADQADYADRRSAIQAFNQASPIIKKGLALTPVKFGISFTAQHLNQAGALIHIYTDGSVQVNHGGTEMGQGLHTKVAQIVSHALGVSMENIQVTATRTDKVPNTSPTAASSGTDLNGMAALNAANQLKTRLIECLKNHYTIQNDSDIIFKDSLVYFNEQHISFADLAQKAYMDRISLSANGFYKTPKIHYDRSQAKGRPFFYFAHGAALAEVEIDTLTGENRVARVDILHDVGQSLNPALDKGQIEGAFIQGMGWLTTEELQWNASGRLVTDGPATYKIPSIGDTPAIFNVDLYESANPETTVFRSKAVGEPPFMLGISVWCALRHAIASLTDYAYAPPLDPPATPEKILNAVMQAKVWKPS